MSSVEGHPGAFVREHVIPQGMTVSEAAKTLGIGRQALSNLLNGKSALSPDMAMRLSKAFGADQQELLNRQAQFDGKHPSALRKEVPVATYSPPFLLIKAREIEEWASGNLEARSHLAAVLRCLVGSTGQELTRLDFPAYDNAERRGWDGTVDAGCATPWIPLGRSGWEFGTNEDPQVKANADFAQRTKDLPLEERQDTTFVFVTPRNWPQKHDWEKKKNALNEWKSVRALDASDLEQWLEQSLPGQVWMAEKLSKPTTGFRSLDRAWRDWSLASNPVLSAALFTSNISDARLTLKNWLAAPPNRPLVVAADSKDEALAFLACALNDPEIATTQQRDQALAFSDPAALNRVGQGSSAFMPIAINDPTEKELSNLYRRLHCITVRPRNAVDSEPDIALSQLGPEDMISALTKMGIEEERAQRLVRETGGSPTILRRRLSEIDAIRTPEWSKQSDTARSIVPMALIGTWHGGSEADKKILARISGRDYERVEQDLTGLLRYDDSPVWSVDAYRGVSSKIDAIFGIKGSITKGDLEGFFEIAELVLSERDPALDLPEDKRWAAGLYSKVRDHSTVIRTGIEETLVLLSVYGNSLFQDRLGFDVQAQTTLLVRKLLSPLTLEKLLSHNAQLPSYAEAAPDEFIRLIQKDLGDPTPASLELMKPAESSFFGGCPRTGLLWALETLAWNPERLPTVVRILARLSDRPIEDNWHNKPLNSLKSIFRSWLPQTAASVEQRTNALALVNREYPKVGWALCIDQFEPYSRTGDHSYRPRWRSDALGFGYSTSVPDHQAFVRSAVEFALAWPSHDETTLGDIVERLQELSDEHQVKAWQLIKSWAEKSNDDLAKASLREKIRRFAFTRRSRSRDLSETTTALAREARDALLPTDVVVRHRWLFADQWIEESSEELETEAFDHDARDQRIRRLREEALAEIWRAAGLDGVQRLVQLSGACFEIGMLLKPLIEGDTDLSEVTAATLKANENSKTAFFLSGLLHAFDANGLEDLTKRVREKAPDQTGRLSILLPFRRDTWQLVESWGEEAVQHYWGNVQNLWGKHSAEDLNFVIDQLLTSKRPSAALAMARFEWSDIETARLKRLLHEVATTKPNPTDNYKFRPYDIAEAFKSLERRSGVATDEKANLEFLYIELLHDHEYGLPNLDKQISQNPQLFVQAIGLSYRRNDGGEDPPDWVIEDSERRTSVATATYHLLHHVKRIPGTGENGLIDAKGLISWIREVRALCKTHGRVDIGDQKIGELLSRAKADEDGTWPCTPVCEALEAFSSEEMAIGFRVGKYNARGAQWRGEGGKQERDLANQYRRWSNKRAYEFPYVASVLSRIADMYDGEARSHDTDAKVRRKLQR